MHMAEGESLFGIHGAALTFRSQRLNLLASNIANAATPGCRARDIDFDPRSAWPRAATAPTGPPVMRSPIACRSTPSIDGNTVELSTEQTLFAENAMQYRTTLSFLEGRISTIRRALKGE